MREASHEKYCFGKLLAGRSLTGELLEVCNLPSLPTHLIVSAKLPEAVF